MEFEITPMLGLFMFLFGLMSFIPFFMMGKLNKKMQKISEDDENKKAGS